jgi:hypothetical protein
MSGYASCVPRPAARSQVRLWDGRWWPCAGRYAGAPVFRYGWAPSGLATVRQLAAKGLRPAGQDPAGWLVWGPPNRPRWAYLYRLDLAAPKRPMTPAMRAAIAACNAALRVCPTCRRDDGYRIPRSLGQCWPCADRTTTDREDAVTREVQPGGHLRQDVPAGLALPTHTTTTTRQSSGYVSSEETAMVGPAPTPTHPAGGGS